MSLKPPLTRDSWQQAITKIRLALKEIYDRLGTAETDIAAIEADYWNSTNDGAGSGLDADLLDGQHGAFYQDASNLNAGTLADARLSSNVPLKNAAATISGLYNYTTRPTVNSNDVYHRGDGLQQQTIALADDTATTITLPSNCSVHFALIIGTNQGNTGATLAHVSPNQNSSAIIAQVAGGLYEVFNGTALTGTTGTDGKATIGVTSNVVYLENRTGGSRTFSLSFLANR